MASASSHMCLRVCSCVAVPFCRPRPIGVAQQTHTHTQAATACENWLENYQRTASIHMTLFFIFVSLLSSPSLFYNQHTHTRNAKEASMRWSGQKIFIGCVCYVRSASVQKIKTTRQHQQRWITTDDAFSGKPSLPHGGPQTIHKSVKTQNLHNKTINRFRCRREFRYGERQEQEHCSERAVGRAGGKILCICKPSITFPLHRSSGIQAQHTAKRHMCARRLLLFYLFGCVYDEECYCAAPNAIRSLTRSAAWSVLFGVTTARYNATHYDWLVLLLRCYIVVGYTADCWLLAAVLLFVCWLSFESTEQWPWLPKLCHWHARVISNVWLSPLCARFSLTISSACLPSGLLRSGPNCGIHTAAVD